MRTHVDGLCTQAYVCTCILVPRNLNFDIFVSFALFVLPNMLQFDLLICFLSCFFSLFICLFVIVCD